ncbi:MAG: DPP IV N-terminal domain-containing protein, partial [Pyrinomonadaceae bacterium]
MKKIALLSLCLALLSISAAAQRTRRMPAASHVTVTAADYERAESRLSYKTNPLIDRNGVRATWLPDGTFWYMVLTATGREYVHIDPKTGARKVGATPAEIGVEGGVPNMNAFARFGGGQAVSVSPDGKLEAFIKDWNLWVRDRATKKETQLTTDAQENYGYATDNAGWKHSPRPILIWSPDSKKIATFQQDERHVKDMYLVTTNVGAPKLEK